MVKVSPFISLIIKAVSGTVSAIAVILLLYGIGPTIETSYFPVVDRLNLLSVEEVVGDRARIFAEFNKLRDCEFIGIAWYKGKRDGNFERVPVTLMRMPGDNSSPTRPLGLQRSGPWVIGMTPDDLRNNSFADLFHKCHPFWTTRTEFYTSAETGGAQSQPPSQ